MTRRTNHASAAITTLILSDSVVSVRMDHIGSKEPRSLLPSTSERIREKQATRMFREQVGHLAA